MDVRSASFRDLSRIEHLYREAMSGELGHLSQLRSETPVPQASTLIRLWYAVSRTLSSLMPLSDSGDMLYVAEHPQAGIVGFVQAENAPGKARAWQIVNLCTDSTPVGQLAAPELLTGLTQCGQQSGVSRFYVRLPLDHPLLPVFMEQGFTQYATEQILFSDSERGTHAKSTTALRAARRDDIGAIHLLYLRVTPATVAAIEAPTLKVWESTFGDGMMAKLGRDDVHHLVEETPGIVGWAAIRPASATRPTVLVLLCDAHDAADRETFVDAVIRVLPEGPVSCVLRHYDSELIRCLQQRGFAIYGTQVLLTKDLSVKIKVHAPARERQKKRALVPAGVVRAVPTGATHPFRVLSSSARDGVPRSET